MENEATSEGTKRGGAKILIIVLLSVIITAGIVYQATELKYKALVEEKDAKIALGQGKIAELQQTTPAVGTAPVTEAKIVCTACHGIEQTKGFHFVENIKLLDESKGQTPRICTTCHGSSPHDVHKKMLSGGKMKCESCHVSSEGDFIIPQVPEGKLLVCEACHALTGKPEDVGNYISIHIMRGNKDCDICHMGDPIKVHKTATEKLGLVNGSIYTTT